MVLGYLVLLTMARRECEQEEREDMVENFVNCTGEFKNEYNIVMEEDNVDVERVTCNLMTSLVDTCGELWGLCHPREEVIRMKAMQVENLILKNSDSEVDIEKCLVVSKYREESTLPSPGHGSLCSKEEESEIRFQFQMCSHNTTTQLYQDIQELKTPVMDIVCQALKDLSDECIGFLIECFREEDLVEIKKLHLKEVINNLVTLESKNVKEQKIDDCEVVKEIMNNSDNDEEVNEESESLKGMTKISVREVMLSSGELSSNVSHILLLAILFFRFLLVIKF